MYRHEQGSPDQWKSTGGLRRFPHSANYFATARPKRSPRARVRESRFASLKLGLPLPSPRTTSHSVKLYPQSLIYPSSCPSPHHHHLLAVRVTRILDFSTHGIKRRASGRRGQGYREGGKPASPSPFVLLDPAKSTPRRSEATPAGIVELAGFLASPLERIVSLPELALCIQCLARVKRNRDGR